MELTAKHIEALKLMLSYQYLTVADARAMGCPLLVVRIMEMEREGIKFHSSLADPDTILGMDKNVYVYWLADPQRCAEIIAEYQASIPPVSSLARDSDVCKDAPGQTGENETADGMLF